MVSANVLGGAVYEAEFQAEVLRRGFVPNIPTIPVAWDIVVVCPSGSLKVQVKGTSTVIPNDRTAYKITTSSGRSSKSRIGKDIDVIACWIDPARVWYLIPSTITMPKTINLYAEAKRSSSKFQTYREDWSIFYKH